MEKSLSMYDLSDWLAMPKDYFKFKVAEVRIKEVQESKEDSCDEYKETNSNQSEDGE